MKLFTTDEIAEAFAATRGVASPTQLRAAMKQDGRDLIARFRALAPERRPIAIQRWNVRRVALGLMVLVGFLLAFAVAKDLLSSADALSIAKSPACGTDNTLIVMAQAVPSASQIPCIAALPAGWTFDQASVRRGQGRFWLNSDRAGARAVVVTLSAKCDVARTPRVRVFRFPGGCTTHEFDFDKGVPLALAADIERDLSFVPRARLVRHVHEDQGLVLCGRGGSCA